MAIARTLAVGAHCPPALLQLTSEGALYDAVEIVRALQCTREVMVQVVRVKCTGELAVVKTFYKAKLNECARLQLECEIDLHRCARHCNVVAFWLAVEDALHKHVVMEYCPGGDLRHSMSALGEQQLRDHIIRPLLDVLVQLDEQGIVHRDIKPENIFLDGAGTAKLGDFGLAVQLQDSPTVGCKRSSSDGSMARSSRSSSSGDLLAALYEHAGGTPAYAAPEVLSAAFSNTHAHAALSAKNDVWALGLIALEAISGGRHPFAGLHDSPMQIACAVVHTRELAPPPGARASPALRDWLSAALARDPSQRASAAQLRDHPWLALPEPECVDGGKRAADGGALAALGGAACVDAPGRDQDRAGWQRAAAGLGAWGGAASGPSWSEEVGWRPGGGAASCRHSGAGAMAGAGRGPLGGAPCLGGMDSWEF